MTTLTAHELSEEIREQIPIAIVADLRLLRDPNATRQCLVLGYYAKGDGGGGDFYWDDSSTATDNGGTVILPTGHSGAGRWLRVYSGFVHTRWCGAKHDGVTDDTVAIQAAIDTRAPVFLDAGTALVSIAAGSYADYALNSFGASTGNRLIAGAGRGRSIIKLSPPGGSTLFNVLAVSNCTLRDFSIDGGFVPASHTADTATTVSCGANTVVDNVEVYNCQGSGLVAGNANNIKWVNNHVHDYGDHALYISGVDGEVSNVVMKGNTLSTTATYRNSGSLGTNRGEITIRDNCTNISVGDNAVDGYIGVEVTGDASASTKCPRRVAVSNNAFKVFYAALFAEMTLTTDNGHRIKRLTFSGNEVEGQNTSGERWGAVLRNATARVVDNDFFATAAGGTTVGIDAGTAGGSEPLIAGGNDFYNCSTGIYIPPADSILRDNNFWVCGTGVEIASQGTKVVGNTFKGCTTVGLYHRAGSSATRQTQIAQNVFQDNLAGMRFNNSSRNVSARGNEFQNNTSSVLVENGAGFNAFQWEENYIQSGAAMPTSGSTDAVAIQPRSTSGTFPRKQLNGSVTWDPADIATGASTSTTMTINGAAIGDTVAVGFSVAVPANSFMVGSVTASNTVTVTLFNNTGANLNLASGTLRADIWKF